jgi:choline-sulfatase
LTSLIDLLSMLPGLAGLAGLDAERLRKKISPDFSDAEPLIGRNLTPLVQGIVSPNSINDPFCCGPGIRVTPTRHSGWSG